MAESVVARDLMLRNHRTIRADQTLREAMRALVDVQAERETPNALGVVDADGQYVGVLTARLLFKSLLTLWMPGRAVREDEGLLQRELREVVEERLRLKLQDALIRGLPAAAPGDRLLALIEKCCDKRLEFVPVVENGQMLGVVPVTAVFNAAAALALTPEHEGIRLEGGPAGTRQAR